MFFQNQMNQMNICEQATLQLQKENYIADMLVRTLYCNDVTQAECYHIIKLFKKKILGDIEL